MRPSCLALPPTCQHRLLDEATTEDGSWKSVSQRSPSPCHSSFNGHHRENKGRSEIYVTRAWIFCLFVFLSLSPSIFSLFPLSPSLGRLLKTPASGQRPSAKACPASSASPVAARVAEVVAAAATACLLSGSAGRSSGRPSWTWPSRSPGANGDEL